MTEEKFLYIIRHGETDFNRQNIVQGSGVDTDLNEYGREQAKKFFKRYGHLPFDKVYTSALKRTAQSVKHFIESGIPHTSLAALNEISWGNFEGLAQSEEQRKVYMEIVGKWLAGDVHAKLENGESPFEMQERQKAAVHHILENAQERNVLICMHGRAMKSLLCLLLNKPLSQMEDFHHTNLCLYLLRYAGGRFELVRHCDVDHLGDGR